MWAGAQKKGIEMFRWLRNRRHNKRMQRLRVEHVVGSLPTAGNGDDGKGWVETNKGEHYRAVDPDKHAQLVGQLRRAGEL